MVHGGDEKNYMGDNLVLYGCLPAWMCGCENAVREAGDWFEFITPLASQKPTTQEIGLFTMYQLLRLARVNPKEFQEGIAV